MSDQLRFAPQARLRVQRQRLDEDGLLARLQRKPAVLSGSSMVDTGDQEPMSLRSQPPPGKG